MLKKLFIQNYAIIEELEIIFCKELNIITGETGAGKSIVVDALGLILGNRADNTVLLSKEKKCIVEGVFSFSVQKEEVTSFLLQNNFDVAEEVIIRRELNANGKSRSFINDTPATLQQLQQLASSLVDLHQQYDVLNLAQSEFQRQTVDALAHNQLLLQQYQSAYYTWQQHYQQWQQLMQQKNEFQKEQDYLQFLQNEFSELALQEQEIETLEQEQQLLLQAEDIKNLLLKIVFELKENDIAVIALMKQLTQQLAHYASAHTSIASLAERLRSIQIELQDIASEAEHINNSLQSDIQKTTYIQERLNAAYKLLQKHHVKTTHELLAIQNEINAKLSAVLSIEQEVEEEEKLAKTSLQQAELLATQLFQLRKQHIPLIEEKVNALLHKVGMPNARFKINIQEANLHAYGKDNIEFLFDGNKAGRFEPLKKVGSGGELSRIMLCIKSLVAETIDLPTLIFDEIDTGISGEAARQVGILLKTIAASRQVVAITHLPQIAGKADAHFYVYKEMKPGGSTTLIRRLNTNERIETIAQMLSGNQPTEAAIANAKEMVQQSSAHSANS